MNAANDGRHGKDGFSGRFAEVPNNQVVVGGAAALPAKSPVVEYRGVPQTQQPPLEQQVAQPYQTYQPIPNAHELGYNPQAQQQYQPSPPQIHAELGYNPQQQQQQQYHVSPQPSHSELSDNNSYKSTPTLSAAQELANARMRSNVSPMDPDPVTVGFSGGVELPENNRGGFGMGHEMP